MRTREIEGPHLSGENPRQAKLVRSRKTWVFWLVPIGAALLAGWFIYSDKIRHGPEIHIYFENAAGLQGGKSQVKYRGATVGDVKEVRLTDDRSHVDVTVALYSSGASLAREGSRFWVVKPEVSIEAIKGLRTVVSGDYITVEPGNGGKQDKFNGLAEAPIVEGEDVLKLVLLSERGGSLRKRTPVFYRGVKVGEVFSSELGPDSQAIKTVIHIQRHFAPLVRTNSKFWNAGGLHMNLSLSGLNVGAQSAETLLSGGIDFATPEAMEQPAKDGTAFRVYDKPQGEWLAWSPVIRLGPDTNSTEQANYGPQQ